MGSKDKRERIARIKAGLEKPIRHEALMASGVKVLQALSTNKQVDVLNASIGTGKLKSGKLRETLENKAPHEMRKGVQKLIKKHKPLTVDNLLEEYRKDKPFQQLANSVGLDEQWFINLAEQEIENAQTKH
jgi:hypothetical protein